MAQIEILANRGVTLRSNGSRYVNVLISQFSSSTGTIDRCFFAWANIDITGLTAKVVLPIKSKSTNTGNDVDIGALNAPLDVNTTAYDASASTVYSGQVHLLPSVIEFPATQAIIQNGLNMVVSSYIWQGNYVTLYDIGQSLSPKLVITIADPTISNLVINNTDVDINTIVSWGSTDQKVYELQVLKSGSIVYSASGTTANNKTIPYNTLPDGQLTFRVRVGNTGIGQTIWSDWAEYTATFTKKEPSISTLEPANINKLLSQAIQFDFTGTNISQWKYEAIQGGVAKYTTTGTTARQGEIPPNVLSTGVVTSRLTAYYIPVWATQQNQWRTAVKEVTFTAYGPPPNPTLDLDAIYSTAYPLFKWTASNEQQAWQLRVYEGAALIFDTAETVGTQRQYQHDVPLENNKIYTAQLRIRNQYNLYSAWASKSFQVSYAELAPPTFNIYANQIEACIVLNIYNEDDETFYKSQVYRRELGTDAWLQVADNLAQNDEFKDFECASGITYEYKVRAISSELTYTDSDVKTMSVKFSYPRLSIAGTNDFIMFDGNYESEVSYDDGKTYQLYAGTGQPKESRSLTNYRVINITADVKYSDFNNFMRIINTQGTLFLRDKKGMAVYGSVSIKGHKDNVLFSYKTLNFVFTETYYGGAQDVVQQECNEFAIKEW